VTKAATFALNQAMTARDETLVQMKRIQTEPILISQTFGDVFELLARAPMLA
jgi:hypothetical protein